ncbi:E3 ubiquitin-protein ligase EL5-like [Panicum miliaceum]|uniref:RING-type E3 ubiquitin transferase n=1 Tax=Panicum miliaceum TaxID=4540 RepID=A0A3L6QJB0_PANMI|nr:E3 ubiquitin-protein ligase EL5-like [Panicum miliaceum]
MTQDSDQGAAGAARSSRPSGGAAAADDAPAPPVSAAAGAMTLGSIFTVAGILLLFVVFAFVLVSLQYCFNAWDRGGRQEDAPSARRRRRRGGSGRGIRTRTRGVDPELLRSLPVTVYRAAALGSKEAGEGAVECAVCLAELEDGEAARFLPRCGHGFHAECVDAWLASHTTCPLCRLTVAKPDAPPRPALLPPVPPEPASYAANLPASVLLGVSDRGTLNAVTVTADGDTGASTGATGVLAIEIPEPAVPAPPPRDAAKSQDSARLRSSFRRLWSFGRQGAGASSSCSCAGAGEGADLEQGTSTTTDRPESNTNFLSSLQ